MENSPFNRSARTARTPPPTPPTGQAPLNHAAEAPSTIETVSTPEIQKWMSSIEQYLNEVCQIAADGKLNSEQKMRISNLCRKVGHGTSQMAVLYQSLKTHVAQAHLTIQNFNDQLDLSQQLQDLKVSIIETPAKLAAGTSFAEMVKKGPNKFIQQDNFNSVAIYPNDKLKSSEDTKSLVQKIIHPEEMKLHVRSLRKTKNGGVIISTETKDDITKLKTSDLLTKSGLTVDEPLKRKPRVVIIGVPNSMSEKEVFTCLYNQNLADKLDNMDLEGFLATIKMSHKSGKKNSESCNYIVEVSAVIRKALISKDRAYINWSSCPVRDFTLVTRCYKCQQYGHAAKSCRETTYTCGHCGDVGHSIKECTKKAEQPKCATCWHFKKPSNHITGAIDCPAKTMAEQRYVNSIDYEGA
jgi:hypothetical protein